MTKAEEMKALESIESLIKSAGPDSYIAIAFRGCVEDARMNIENDWGCSRADAAEAAEKKAKAAIQELSEVKAAAAEAAEKLEQITAYAAQMKDTISASLKILRSAWNDSKANFERLTDGASDAEITKAFRDMKAKESAVKAACECL